MILDGEDDFVNMLRHVLGVLGHDQPRWCATRTTPPGAPRRRRPGHRRARAGRPARRRRPQDGPAAGAPSPTCSPPGSRSSRSAWATRRCATSSASTLAYKDIVFQGTQSPVGIDGPHRAGRLLQHLRRPGRRRGAARRRRGRGRPGRPATSTLLAGRTTAASSSTPSRSSPSTATTCCTTSSAGCCSSPSRRRSRSACRSSTGVPDVVVVDHHDSYTWNLVHLVAGVTGVLPTVVQHDEVGAGRRAAALARRALAGPGRARRPGGLRGRPRGAAGRDPAGARRLPRDAGPGDGVRRHASSGSCRATAWWRRCATTARGSSPGCRRTSTRCATTRWRRSAAVVPAGDRGRRAQRADDGRRARRRCRWWACSSTRSRCCRSTAPRWSRTSSAVP